MQTLQADYFATYRHLKLSRDAKLRMPTGRSASMLVAFSKARNQRTCRSCNHPSLSWSSTLKPPKS
jgi:hypothetical protein